MQTQPLHTAPATDRKASNPAAWVDLYGDYLFHYALSRVADKGIAEELLQEAFTAAIAAYNDRRFHGNSTEKTWLTGILKHKITDHLRRKYRYRALPLDLAGESDIEESFDASGKWRVRPGSWGTNPPDHFEQRELAQLLLTCIGGLQERQADAIRLRELEDRDTEEICEVLAISPTNYWVLIHRARLALRRCMEGRWSLEA